MNFERVNLEAGCCSVTKDLWLYNHHQPEDDGSSSLMSYPLSLQAEHHLLLQMMILWCVLSVWFRSLDLRYYIMFCRWRRIMHHKQKQKQGKMLLMIFIFFFSFSLSLPSWSFRRFTYLCYWRPGLFLYMIIMPQLGHQWRQRQRHLLWSETTLSLLPGLDQLPPFHATWQRQQSNPLFRFPMTLSP